MKIYLDLIFLENFIINFVLIYETHIIAKQKFSLIRGIITSLLGAIYVVILTYLRSDILNFFIMKILLSICMVYIAFKPKKVLVFIKLISFFYLISFIYVGIISVISNIFNLETNTIFITVFIYGISVLISWIFLEYQGNYFKLNVLKKNLMYCIIIEIGYNKFSYNGMVDTGNNVKDTIYNKNVIFLEKDENLLIELVKNNITTTKVTMKSVNNITEEIGYVVDKVSFINENKEHIVKSIVIVFINGKLSNNKFNALIGVNTYLEDLEGMLL